MGANLKEPFGPSCCEGEICAPKEESAQPCGCDAKAQWVCEVHRGALHYATTQMLSVNLPDHLFQTNTLLSTRVSTLPTDSTERKKYPVASGVLGYFPDAIAAIAHVSWQGNEQHNPSQPLHWARHKSTDQADTMIRHFLERGTLDTDGMRHSAKMAWRALAILQLEIEAEGK